MVAMSCHIPLCHRNREWWGPRWLEGDGDLGLPSCSRSCLTLNSSVALQIEIYWSNQKAFYFFLLGMDACCFMGIPTHVIPPWAGLGNSRGAGGVWYWPLVLPTVQHQAPQAPICLYYLFKYCFYHIFPSFPCTSPMKCLSYLLIISSSVVFIFLLLVH